METEQQRKNVYKILDSIPLSTIANVFSAASIIADGIGNKQPDPYLVNAIKQEGTRAQISIAASKLILAAHT